MPANGYHCQSETWEMSESLGVAIDRYLATSSAPTDSHMSGRNHPRQITFSPYGAFFILSDNVCFAWKEPTQTDQSISVYDIGL